jgi:hypothetical protein
MKLTSILVFVLAVVFNESTAFATNCSDQFSACLTAEIANNTSNGTGICLEQRTTCVALLQGPPGQIVPPVNASFDPFAVTVVPNATANLGREHRQEDRSLRQSQSQERQNLRDQHKAERDANNWKEFGGILAQQVHENIDLRREQRQERKNLNADQKGDGQRTAWSN